jgi:hypothetical protein
MAEVAPRQIQGQRQAKALGLVNVEERNLGNNPQLPAAQVAMDAVHDPAVR